MDLNGRSEMATSVTMISLMDWDQPENRPQLKSYAQESAIKV